MSVQDDTDSMRPRRKHRRVTTREVTAEVRARESTLSYSVVNISTGGLLLAGGPLPPRTALLDISLRMTGTRPVEVTGRVIYEIPAGIGVAFEPFSSSVAESLEKLIVAVAARTNLPPPLPSRPHRDEAPAAPVVLGPDPFATGPDPRPPRSGSPDERIDYLRALVKKRDEGIARGRTLLTALAAQADELRATAARLESKLEATVGQLAIGEAALAASRRSTEKNAKQLDQERATAREMLEAEQRATLEAIGAVAALEAKLRRLETDTTSARDDAEAARREVKEVASEAVALKKTRNELGAANKKAMEAQAAFGRERAARVAAEATIHEAQVAQQAAEAEAKTLAADLARLKAKLIAAENALERSAARKAPDHPR